MAGSGTRKNQILLELHYEWLHKALEHSQGRMVFFDRSKTSRGLSRHLAAAFYRTVAFTDTDHGQGRMDELGFYVPSTVFHHFETMEG